MQINIKNISTAFLGAAMLFTTSCTKNLEDINVDQKAITAEDLEQDYAQIKSYFPGMMNSIMKINPEWMYQIQQNLNADIFSGYMMTPTPFAGNVNNTTYSMMDGWNNFAISVPVENVLNPWKEVKSLTEEKYKDWYSISLILKVFAGHRIVDIFGPFPYSDFGTTSEFDSEQKAYNAFFDDLNTAITTLEGYKGSESETAFASVDISTLNGSYTKWIQLANSLRLRLAIRISNVDPSLAETMAKKSLSHPDGLLEDDDFMITHSFNHPINTVSQGWGDILMGAPMESILGGYSDPRLQEYFLPIKTEDGNSPYEGEVRGIRQGINLTAKAEYGDFSRVNINSGAPIQLMTASEVYFLRAEAALRGWGGNAKDLYENGIERSFLQHGVALGSYLSNTAKPTPYVDPLHPENNVGPNDVSGITVAWDDAASNEEKLERIITQKWIATFPDGQEAWSEHRRTGYPVLFPVVINNSNGEIADGEFISRLSYPADFKATNPSAVQEAVDKYLGGNDSPGQKLWWAKY